MELKLGGITLHDVTLYTNQAAYQLHEHVSALGFCNRILPEFLAHSYSYTLKEADT